MITIVALIIVLLIYGNIYLFIKVRSLSTTNNELILANSRLTIKLYNLECRLSKIVKFDRSNQ